MTAPWSYSSLTSFETCPLRHKLTKIDKIVVEPQGEALKHGNEVHKALELAVKDSVPLPSKYAQYSQLVSAVLAAPGQKTAETRFGLTLDLQPTDFFARDVWVRGVLDLTIERAKSAIVLDWKTGKPKSDPGQLRLFAGAAFAQMPGIDVVHTGYVWLGANKIDRQTFARDEAPEIWGEFRSRVLRMEIASDEGNYPPKPSGLCRAWCPVPRSLCSFSGKE